MTPKTMFLSLMFLSQVSNAQQADVFQPSVLSLPKQLVCSSSEGESFQFQQLPPNRLGAVATITSKTLIGLNHLFDLGKDVEFGDTIYHFQNHVGVTVDIAVSEISARSPKPIKQVSAKVTDLNGNEVLYFCH
jgi:hypothetical protein